MFVEVLDTPMKIKKTTILNKLKYLTYDSIIESKCYLLEVYMSPLPKL